MVGQTHKIPNLCDVGANKLVNFPANPVFSTDREKKMAVGQPQRVPDLHERQRISKYVNETVINMRNKSITY